MHLELETVQDLNLAQAVLAAQKRRIARIVWRIGLVKEQVVPPARPSSPTKSRLPCQEADLMLLLTDTQDCDIEVVPVTKKQNVAEVENPVFTSSDEGIVTVTPDPTNPLKAKVSAVDVGTAQVNFTCDAVVGEGESPLAGTLDVEVKAGTAVGLTINTGTPTEQP